MSHVTACTGWTWDTVLSELDLPRLAALNLYWESHPPVHILIAAYMGVKPKQAINPITKTEITSDQIDMLGDNLAMGPAPIYLTMDEYKAKKIEAVNE